MRMALLLMACVSVEPGSTEAPLSSQPRAVLEFRAGWTIAQHGALVRGGHLDLRYDAARLPGCDARQAFVKFQPSGWLSAGPFAVDIPDGTTSAELWFQ